MLQNSITTGKKREQQQLSINVKKRAKNTRNVRQIGPPSATSGS